MAKFTFSVLFVLACICVLCSAGLAFPEHRRDAELSRTDMATMGQFLDCMQGSGASRDDSSNFDFSAWMNRLGKCAEQMNLMGSSSSNSK